MIQLENVTKVYQMGTVLVRALDGVSLRVERGEFVAITGASGSGKSTMMHIIGCLDRPSSGSYQFTGQHVETLSERQLALLRNQAIGFVFQSFNLINSATAQSNVALPLFYAGQTRTRNSALEALEHVGLSNRARHRPVEMSGGERQRVAIARAIVNNPDVILADEPTGNLDSKTGRQIMDIFHRFNAQGVTVILVTHEAEVAAQARRVIQMRDGKIADDRPVDGRAATVWVPRPPGSDPSADDAREDQDSTSAPTRPSRVHPTARRAWRGALFALGCWLLTWLWSNACADLPDTVAANVFKQGVFFGLVAGMVFGAMQAVRLGRRARREMIAAGPSAHGRWRARAAALIGGVMLLVISLIGALLIVGLLRKP